MIRYVATTNTIAVIVNSNMLPHGARPAASPRNTTPATLSPKPITVSATPIRPNCSTRSALRSEPVLSLSKDGSESSTPTAMRSGLPSLSKDRASTSSALIGATCRAEAHSAAWANMANAYTTTELTKDRLE